MRNYLKLLFLTVSLYGGTVVAQIPVEVFAGNEKATIDMMFFRFFKNQREEPSRVLFFNRNRASVDYQMTSSSKLPQFGLTEAISYNHPKLKGFAPVFVAQVFNSGVYPKIGAQYVFFKENFTIFTWLVTEIANNSFIDYYLLLRFTPEINTRLKLFTQMETLNAFPTVAKDYSFTQRFRIGLKMQYLQFGIGTDLAETGKNTIKLSSNTGLFLRYEF